MATATKALKAKPTPANPLDDHRKHIVEEMSRWLHFLLNWLCESNYDLVHIGGVAVTLPGGVRLRIEARGPDHEPAEYNTYPDCDAMRFQTEPA